VCGWSWSAAQNRKQKNSGKELETNGICPRKQYRSTSHAGVDCVAFSISSSLWWCYFQVLFPDNLGDIYKVRVGFAGDSDQHENWLLDSVRWDIPPRHFPRVHFPLDISRSFWYYSRSPAYVLQCFHFGIIQIKISRNKYLALICELNMLLHLTRTLWQGNVCADVNQLHTEVQSSNHCSLIAGIYHAKFAII